MRELWFPKQFHIDVMLVYFILIWQLLCRINTLILNVLVTENGCSKTHIDRRLTDIGIPNDSVWRGRHYVLVWLVKFDFQLILVRVFLTNCKRRRGRETPTPQKQQEGKHNGEQRKRERSWASDSRKGEGSRAPYSGFDPRKCTSHILHLLSKISSYLHHINIIS